MPTYVFYDRKTGEIAHVHRTLFMDSGQTLDLSEDELFQEVGPLLPEGVDLGVATNDEPLRPPRGKRYYVDPTTRRLALLEAAPAPRDDTSGREVTS